MKTDLDVAVDTKADASFIFVNFKEVPLVAGKGRTQVEVGQGDVLQWGIVGTPGTEYKITLKPSTGKLQIGGEHPIDLKIPQGFTRAAGIRRFSVVAGGA
jgi:hypothetical protein